MEQTEEPASITEVECFVARATIGHNAGDGYPKALVISDYACKKGAGTGCILVREDGRVTDAGSVIDSDLQISPTGTSALGMTLVAPAEAVADRLEAQQRFDVQTD